MGEVLISILLLLLAVPVGFLISYMAKDELRSGKKYIRILFIFSIIASIWFFLTRDFKFAFSFLFLAIISVISLILTGKLKDK